jgi:HSP20 family molecular chaperone IbpA
MSDKNIPSIPYDMYESPQEVVIIIPLGWVKKESVEVKIENYRIQIHWFRTAPQLKESCIPIQEECYRGPIELHIEIPPQVYFDRIHSKLTLDNTLEIIIPKALVPEKIQLEVEYENENK